ncbi:OLC1v1012085C2 [Oldenlandia corymbosa var. corymbosa]|uniref:OLC1v1012085C2 n=1 Tax=Oldenlandia corymbosa var. corymbosa TaxID=529605 RepID=A0AAV1DV56_OLDCO|nr:OLC1v1012085C2 [Oldenlandia corymbosa var. corymbosa]
MADTQGKPATPKIMREFEFPALGHGLLPSHYSRKDFGDDFYFGPSSSSFQIEGGHRRDGRRRNIFDTFAEKNRLFDQYGEDAINHREHFKADVDLIKQMGFNSYRFSISWSRILPTGKKESKSEAGIKFYKDLFEELKQADITPMVTLLHFDPPQDLEDEYHTFLRPEIVDDFCDYAEICFEEFGDYVKYWTTINEPWYVAYGGYIEGAIPPGFRSDRDYDALQTAAEAKSGKTFDHQFCSICPPYQCSHKSLSAIAKNSTSLPNTLSRVVLPPKDQWPYVAVHYQILAHAKAFKLYKEKYQKTQGGKIGINIVAQWFIPLEDTLEDRDAAQRALDFMVGWVMEPVYSGCYPENMVKYATKGFLPKLDKDMVKGTYDFVSFIYYTSRYVSNLDLGGGDYILDRRVEFHERSKDGVPIGNLQGAAGWIYDYPQGLLECLRYIKKNYGDPEIYIHENGFDDPDRPPTDPAAIHDADRVQYLHDHLDAVQKAIKEDVNVKGYFVWSLMDNLELGVGHDSRFGIIYIDYKDLNSKRMPKLSASWFKHFLANDQTKKKGATGDQEKEDPTKEESNGAPTKGEMTKAESNGTA